MSDDTQTGTEGATPPGTAGKAGAHGTGPAVEVGELIAPVGSWLKPYQLSQRYIVVDERHVGAEDLPGTNLMAAVLGLEPRGATTSSST